MMEFEVYRAVSNNQERFNGKKCMLYGNEAKMRYFMEKEYNNVFHVMYWKAGETTGTAAMLHHGVLRRVSDNQVVEF